MDWEAEIMREMSGRAFRECEKLRALEEQTTQKESESQWEKWEKENVRKLSVRPEALEKRIKEGKVKDMSEKQTTHNYDFKQFTILGHMYLWRRTDSTTDVLNEYKQMLFNIPFVAEERDVRMALFGYLQHDLRKFAAEIKRGEK